MKRSLTIIAALFLLISSAAACGSGPAVTEQPVSGSTAIKPGTSGKPVPEQDWERILSDARKEGSLTFYSQYGNDWQQSVSEAMKQKYGITMQFVTASTGENTARILAEYQRGIRIADAMAISTSVLKTFQTSGILQPLEKELTLPEVTDPKAWYRGQLNWLDPDEKTTISWRENVNVPLVINTDQVKPGELQSWDDVLNPRWKGKLLLNDPTSSGGGQLLMVNLAYKLKDWDFVRALLRQEPDLQRDDRLLVEWLAKGKYPILIGPRNEVVWSFVKAGAPLKNAQLPTYTSVGDGNIVWPKNGPHPNAARVFINYFLSKEGQTAASRTTGHHSLRVDVPTDFLDPGLVRQPGVNYISTSDKSFLDAQEEMRGEVARVFRAYLSK
ncbi:MAG: extracellular solute-binding protein [Chloroflexi bacterium]|nr:extracellular solute-binding protein [Chloroflexota bacterium]